MSSPETSAARWIAVRASDALRSTSRGPQHPLAELATLRHAQGLVSRAEILLIEAARQDGASWAEIAAARGTTRQNERQADKRRKQQAAREPFDVWLEKLVDKPRREEREKRRRNVVGW